MARKGEPGRAVWLGVWASFFGGLVGGLFLILVTGPLAAIALAFGPWEYFSLFVLAMAMVAGLAEASLVKGLLSTAIGLLITVIGTDPIGAVPRFTFGSEFIGGGFPFLPVLIGIFAFAQIMTDVEKMRQPGAQGEVVAKRPSLSVAHLKVIGEILGRPFLFLWSVIVGILIGVLPAIGGSAASVLAYDQAKKFSKTPELFGTGHPEGIIASEASNNANVGGSLVTIMAFGIPGDAVTAVMLGAMTIHGIQSGPLFVSQNPGLAYGIYAAYILAHPLMVMIIWASTLLRAAAHHRPPRGAGADRAGAVRDRRLCAQQHHAERVRAADLRRGRLRAGEGRLSAGAADPGADPGRPDRDQPDPRHHDRRQSLAVPDAADLGRAADRLRRCRWRSPSGSTSATRSAPRARKTPTSDLNAASRAAHGAITARRVREPSCLALGQGLVRAVAC